MNDALKRYTELPFVMQALSTRELTLLSSSSWDDKNDAFYLERYRKMAGHQSLVVMCLSETTPTYHHWRLFTHGASGAALYFKRNKFMEWLGEHQELQGRSIDYRTEERLKEHPITVAELPYVKRWAYKAEAEFRVLMACAERNIRIKNVPFNLDMIDQVVLNPWLPKPTYESVKVVLQSINGCKNITVRRAAMVASDRWQKLAMLVEA